MLCVFYQPQSAEIINRYFFESKYLGFGVNFVKVSLKYLLVFITLVLQLVWQLYAIRHPWNVFKLLFCAPKNLLWCIEIVLSHLWRVGTNRPSNNKSVSALTRLFITFLSTTGLTYTHKLTMMKGRKGEGLPMNCELAQANKKKKGLSVNTQSTRSKTYWSIWRMRTSTWRRMITGSTCILIIREIDRWVSVHKFWMPVWNAIMISDQWGVVIQ